MRVVSLVPSWTESLVEWGCQVVGRTRFCIHPTSKVSDIPAVGGTKDPDFEKIQKLSPDLLIVDKEENNKDVLKKFSGDIHVSHVQSVWDMPIELQRLAQSFLHKKDLVTAARILKDRDLWEETLNLKPTIEISKLPGVIEWLRPPSVEVDRVLYLIWKDPWMVVSEKTFIGSILGFLGHGTKIPEFPSNYPQINLESYLDEKTLLLFSSEPFPFEKKKKDLESFPNPMAIVDGESYSWFGVRSLKFLRALSPSSNG